jgi:hypothetical protein
MSTMTDAQAGADPATPPVEPAANENVETIEMTSPIIVDLGRERSRRIKDLKRGEGRLMDEVLEVIDDVGDMLGSDAEDKILVPIILIYSRSSRRDRDDDDDDDDGDDNDDYRDGIPILGRWLYKKNF